MAPEREQTELSQDRALARGLKAGKRQAWGAFCQLYGAPLYRFVAARVDGDEHVAKDVAQDAMVAALESIRRYAPGQGSLWAWLCGIAVNKAREQARSAARQERIRERMEAAPESEGAGQESSPEWLLDILYQLQPSHQEVLSLKYIEDLSVAEVAQRLNASDKAVESRLTRAREAFRRVASAEGAAPSLGGRAPDA